MMYRWQIKLLDSCNKNADFAVHNSGKRVFKAIQMRQKTTIKTVMSAALRGQGEKLSGLKTGFQQTEPE